MQQSKQTSCDLNFVGFNFAGRNLDGTCDTTCRVLVGAIATFVLIVLPTTLFLYWKKRYLFKSNYCLPMKFFRL